MSYQYVPEDGELRQATGGQRDISWRGGRAAVGLHPEMTKLKVPPPRRVRVGKKSTAGKKKDTDISGI